jgi:serine/threonine protein kinase
MSINHITQNTTNLKAFHPVCLPELCARDNRLQELYQSTLHQFAQVSSKSDYKLYSDVLFKSFQQEVIDCKGSIIEINNRGFLVRLKHAKVKPESASKQPQIFIIDLDSMKHLGSGVHFAARAVHEVVSGKRIAFKSLIPVTDHPTFDRAAMNEARRSKQFLKYLNPLGLTNGVLKKPFATIGLTNYPSQFQVMPLLPLVGTLETAYDSELYDRIQAISKSLEMIKATRRERLKMGEQLLQGLAAIHEKKLTHGDLKLENALVIGQGESIIVHISDFGSVRALDFECPPPNASGTHSHEYNLLADITREEEAFRKRNWLLLHLYRTKRDLFEMGVVVTMCLTGNCPFQTEPDQYISLNKSNLNTIVPKVWPAPQSEKILNLLNRMMNANPFLRPSAKQALQLYQELIDTEECALTQPM